METLTACLILGIYALILAMIGRRIGVIDPIILVLGGLALSTMPFIPELHLDPKVVLTIFLPPVLYQAALGLTWRELRTHMRSILLLAVGLVIVTAFTVGLVAWLLIPGITIGAALVLGAIVSPPDAVAANAVLHRLRVPRRIVTILEGESLINDATALVFYALAVAAVVSGVFHPLDVVKDFLWVALAGIGIGLVLGKLSIRLHRMTEDPLLEAMISLTVPFTCFILAEHFHASGVLAVVAAGLLRAAYAPRVMSAASRMQIHSMWNIIVFVLNAIGFLLIGTQIRTIYAAVNGEYNSHLDLAFYAFVICTTVILVRFVWLYPAAWLPRALSPRLRRIDPMPPHGQILVIGWSGMRGIVSLVAALALPTTIDPYGLFPGRDMILYLTYCVILVTLVGQGSTLGWLARKLNVEVAPCDDPELRQARARLREAGLSALEQAASKHNDIAAQRVMQQYREMLADLKKRDNDDHLEDLITRDSRDYQALAAIALKAERSALLRMMRRREIDDQTARRLQRELDLHEVLASNAEPHT